ncbi:MAG: hypothetical protein EHM47_09740 [Ignavibacteriales bacterium]|nr:MAG: hypothetical protein EHM47_09740 [Ignavibacteriales bacterium]
MFAKGKDGGKDARFTGKADAFPSKSKPWQGKFIIQAKHTTNPVASCSDSEFQTIIKKELPKLKKMKTAGELEYYLLFTNRKLTGVKDGKLRNLLEDYSYEIIGDEKIQLWLQEYPEVVKAAQLSKLLLPLEFYEQDLQELIIAFSKCPFSDEQVKDIQEDLARIPLDEKNRLNNLSKEYYENSLENSYEYFSKIKSFLVDPRNDSLKNMYKNTVSDLQDAFLLKRGDFYSMEYFFDICYKKISDDRKLELRNKRSLIRVFLHYMYFNCDIGIKVVN